MGERMENQGEAVLSDLRDLMRQHFWRERFRNTRTDLIEKHFTAFLDDKTQGGQETLLSEVEHILNLDVQVKADERRAFLIDLKNFSVSHILRE